MINHRQLQHVLLLAEYRNFTRAAQKANLSQSAFSRSIRTLETYLGVALFERAPGSVQPTPFGEALLRRARSILAEADDLEREILLMRGLETGSFSVSLGVFPAEVSGNRAMGELLNQHPSLNCRAYVGNWQTAISHVRERTVDLGFAAIEVAEPDERLQVVPVSEHEMVLYARRGHPLANTGSLAREELNRYPLVSIRVPAGLADAVPGRAAVEPESGFLVPSMEIDDFTTARTIVVNSNGIGAAVPLQIEQQLLSGELVLLDFIKPWLKPVHGFILLKDRILSPAAELYMQKVREIEASASARNKYLIEQFLG